MIAGENGIGLNGNVNTSYKHFAPRLGIAYQLEPKTVIRAGYGRSYDVGVFGVSFGHNVTQNLPVLANQSLNPANPWLPVFTLAQGPPALLDPSTILATQPKGPNGNPLLPNGISPNVLPLTIRTAPCGCRLWTPGTSRSSTSSRGSAVLSVAMWGTRATT